MKGKDFIIIGLVLNGFLIGWMMGALMWQGGILAIGTSCLLYGLNKDNYQSTRRNK